MILAFTLVLRMDLLTASGCAKTANLASNVASAVVWIVGGKVLWRLVVPAAVCCVLGNWCGARYAIRGGMVRFSSVSSDTGRRGLGGGWKERCFTGP